MVGKYKVVTLCGSTRFKDVAKDIQIIKDYGGNDRVVVIKI